MPDSPPKWQDLFGDIRHTRHTQRLYRDKRYPYEKALALHDYDWYSPSGPDVHLKPQYIAGHKIWWSPTQKGRTLINKSADLPELQGDKFERLRHRYTVALTELNWLVECDLTQAQILPYDTLTLSTDSGKNNYKTNIKVGYHTNDSNNKINTTAVAEILTGHNNKQNWLNTGKKLFEISRNGINTQLVTPTRDTLFTILNCWAENGAEYSGKRLHSGSKLSQAKKKIQKANNSGAYPVSQVDTISSLQLDPADIPYHVYQELSS